MLFQDTASRSFPLFWLRSIQCTLSGTLALSIFHIEIKKNGIQEETNMRKYELTLTSSYVQDWDFPMAIRKLIQNGVDQETVKPNAVFSIEKTAWLKRAEKPPVIDMPFFGWYI